MVGRGINDVATVVADAVAQPEAAAGWTDRTLYELAGKLRRN